MAPRSLPIVGNVNPRSVRDASAHALTKDLRRPVTRARAAQAVADASAWSEELTAAVAEDVPPELPIACRAGCAYCCSLKVVVTAPEAIQIADWLRANRDERALSELRARVAATDDRTHGMTVQQRLEARIPCPLLESNLCSVHEVRPLVCRGGNSYDADVCRRSLETPKTAPEFRFYRPQVAINDKKMSWPTPGARARQTPWGLHATPSSRSSRRAGSVRADPGAPPATRVTARRRYFFCSAASFSLYFFVISSCSCLGTTA